MRPPRCTEPSSRAMRSIASERVPCWSWKTVPTLSSISGTTSPPRRSTRWPWRRDSPLCLRNNRYVPRSVETPGLQSLCHRVPAGGAAFRPHPGGQGKDRRTHTTGKRLNAAAKKAAAAAKPPDEPSEDPVSYFPSGRLPGPAEVLRTIHSGLLRRLRDPATGCATNSGRRMRPARATGRPTPAWRSCGWL